MLLERHNLAGVVSVQLIERASNAFVGNSSNVRRIGKAPLSVEHDKDKSAFNLNFRRNVKQLWQMFHLATPNKDVKRDPFSFEGGTAHKGLQHITLVNSALTAFSRRTVA